MKWMQQRLQRWLKVPNQDSLHLQCQHLQATLLSLRGRVETLESQILKMSPTAESVVPQGMEADHVLSVMPDAHLGAQ